jgi:hypothetical protein
MIGNMIDFMDHKNSLAKRSCIKIRWTQYIRMMEPGWWALHAMAITGVLSFGKPHGTQS